MIKWIVWKSKALQDSIVFSETSIAIYSFSQKYRMWVPDFNLKFFFFNNKEGMRWKLQQAAQSFTPLHR